MTHNGYHVFLITNNVALLDVIETSPAIPPCEHFYAVVNPTFKFRQVEFNV